MSKKHVITSLLCLLYLLVAFPFAAFADNRGLIVYYAVGSKSAYRYHSNNNCSSLSRSTVGEITLAEAAAKGLTPCSLCKPPAPDFDVSATPKPKTSGEGYSHSTRTTPAPTLAPDLPPASSPLPNQRSVTIPTPASTTAPFPAPSAKPLPMVDLDFLPSIDFSGFLTIISMSIGDNAFYGVYSVPTISIPSTVVEIGINPFYGMSNLEEITVSPKNKIFTVQQGALYNREENLLIAFPSKYATSSFAFRDGITAIITINGIPYLKFDWYDGTEQRYATIINGDMIYMGRKG